MKKYKIQHRLKLLLYYDGWWDVENCNSLKKQMKELLKKNVMMKKMGQNGYINIGF